MARFSTKEELLADATAARVRLERLVVTIPDVRKLDPIVSGMSVKDVITHRTEWGRMMINWYNEAVAGGSPAVPAEGYRWGQLNELNAEIHNRFADTPLDEADAQFTKTNDELFRLIEACSEHELFEKQHLRLHRLHHPRRIPHLSNRRKLSLRLQAHQPMVARQPGRLRDRMKVCSGDDESTITRRAAPMLGRPFSQNVGGDLLSRDPAVQVPSARAGLTSVFGMGTGGTPPPLPPKPSERSLSTP